MTKDRCPGCGGDPAEWLRKWKSGEETEVWSCCLAELRPRLAVSPKRTSTLSRSKAVENRVSKYLFGRLRDWEALHDVSGGGYRGEVKGYDHSTISAHGGAYAVLEAALEQCKSVCGDYKAFACLVPKGTRAFEKSLVLLDDGRLLTLEQFKHLLEAEDA